MSDPRWLSEIAARPAAIAITAGGTEHPVLLTQAERDRLVAAVRLLDKLNDDAGAVYERFRDDTDPDDTDPFLTHLRDTLDEVDRALAETGDQP